MLASVDKFSTDAIVHFRKTGESDVIPVHVQEMIIQLERAHNLLRVKFSVKRAAFELMKEFPQLSYTTAKERIADSINYFHSNIKVSNEAWDQHYADVFDELAHKCERRGEMMEARRNRIKAWELRTKRNEDIIDIDSIQPITMIISPDVTPERLGLKKQNLKKLWNQSKEMIKGFDLNKEEKNKLIREAAYTLGEKPVDADFEDIEEND